MFKPQKVQKKKGVQFKLKVNLWTVALGLLVIFFVIPLIVAGVQLSASNSNADISQVLSDIKAGKVDKIQVQGSKLTVTYKDGSIKFSTKEDTEGFSSLLKDSGIDPATVKVFSCRSISVYDTLVMLPELLSRLILMAAFFYYILKSQSKGAQDIFSFGRSRAKIFAKGKQDITFTDVAGVDEAKKELEELGGFS